MRLILIAVLALFSVAPSFAQSTPRQDASQENSGDYGRTQNHGYGWIGLLGLAGLAGLRRAKSPEHERMQARGVNVKAV